VVSDGISVQSCTGAIVENVACIKVANYFIIILILLIIHNYNVFFGSPAKGKPLDASVDGFGSAFLDSTTELKLVPPARDTVDGEEPHFIPEVTEIRANPVVSRKGYLRVEDGDEEWMRRWVVRHLRTTSPASGGLHQVLSGAPST